MFSDVDMHIAHVVAFHRIQRITETWTPRPKCTKYHTQRISNIFKDVIHIQIIFLIVWLILLITKEIKKVKEII